MQSVCARACVIKGKIDSLSYFLHCKAIKHIYKIYHIYSHSRHCIASLETQYYALASRTDSKSTAFT